MGLYRGYIGVMWGYIGIIEVRVIKGLYGGEETSYIQLPSVLTGTSHFLLGAFALGPLNPEP